MNTYFSRKRVFLPVFTAGALGILISAADSHAVDAEQQLHSTEATASSDPNTVGDFQEVDQNADDKLVWQEIHAYYDDELETVSWSESAAMGWFDTDYNQALNPREYELFLTNLLKHPSSRQAELSERAVTSPADDGQQGPNATGPQGQTEDIVLREQDTNAEIQNAETQNIVLEENPIDLSEQQETAGTGQQGNNENPWQDLENQTTANWTSAGTGTEQNQNQAQGTTSDSGNSALGDLNASDIKGRSIQNMEGQTIGEVTDLVLRQDGAEAGLVVSLGEEGKEIFVALSEVQLSQEELVWQTPLDREAAKQMQEYNEQLYLSIE